MNTITNSKVSELYKDLHEEIMERGEDISDIYKTIKSLKDLTKCIHDCPEFVRFVVFADNYYFEFKVYDTVLQFRLDRDDNACYSAERFCSRNDLSEVWTQILY